MGRVSLWNVGLSALMVLHFGAVSLSLMFSLVLRVPVLLILVAFVPVIWVRVRSPGKDASGNDDDDDTRLPSLSIGETSR